jgi:hypothetical protein
MAEKNPTGGGDPVALTVSPEQRKFLCSVFRMARAGIKDELASYPNELREPVRLRREKAIYERLLEALETGALVPEGGERSVVCDLAQVIDADNEYERVISEHEALHGLLDQLDEARAR